MNKRLKDVYRKIVPYVGLSNEANRIQWVQTALSNIPAGHKILDAGAGQQRYKDFCSHLQYVSQDFAQYDGEGDGRGLHTKGWKQVNLDIISDICNIPVADNSFDAILCIEVIEHLPYPHKALKELRRILRPGGKLILTAPFASLTHFAPYHFCSGFNKYYYQKHLSDLGFTILELSVNGNFFEFLAQELYRLDSVSSRYAGKSLSLLDKMAIYILALKLKKYSKMDMGSSELLAFGYHVLAQKK